VLELDEMWSFVQKKANKRWLWVALCRRTRQVVAFYLGDRGEGSCRRLFFERIPDGYRECQSFSDFWAAYQKVFPDETHPPADRKGQRRDVAP
jgi:IS1 family transposase